VPPAQVNSDMDLWLLNMQQSSSLDQYKYPVIMIKQIKTLTVRKVKICGLWIPLQFYLCAIKICNACGTRSHSA